MEKEAYSVYIDTESSNYNDYDSSYLLRHIVLRNGLNKIIFDVLCIYIGAV
jgi:hypothetical protein